MVQSHKESQRFEFNKIKINLCSPVAMRSPSNLSILVRLHLPSSFASVYEISYYNRLRILTARFLLRPRSRKQRESLQVYPRMPFTARIQCFHHIPRSARNGR